METRREEMELELERELEAVNRFAKTPLTAEEVYTFSVRLCDNEVDRDFERFDGRALESLGELFTGKTGLFDHQWTAQGQTARIYRTEVVEEPARQTMAGDAYRWLKGWAYLLRTEKNAELIAEIEGGIKREVSVGCSVRERVCSVCGGEPGRCGHVKGETYEGRLCFVELRQPTDAYEWSFVAVPAQREAGVLRKRFEQSGGEERRLRQEAALGRKYLASLRKEVVRLAMLAGGEMDGQVFARTAERLEEPELLELKGAYEAAAARRFPAPPQLGRQTPAEEKGEDETAFLV